MSDSLRARMADRTRLRLAVESLETRNLLSGFQSGGALTISFAPDGTDISGSESSLFASMGDRHPSAWQGAIVRAFETWAQYLDLEVRLVADGGAAFGTAGGHGEIRIGAIGMSENIVASSVSHDEAAAGSWAGDLLFNSEVDFHSADEVFRVALHEAGHVLGLSHSDDVYSVMHEVSPAGALTAADIASVQALFGLGDHGNPDGHTTSQAAIDSVFAEGQDADHDDLHSAVVSVGGSVSGIHEFVATFELSATQLVHFELSSVPSIDSGVIATIYDPAGNVVHKLGEANGGQPVILGPGEYEVRVSVLAPEGSAELTERTYRLEGVTLDQHLDVEASDPSGAPITPCIGGTGEFCYPDDIYTWDTFIWVDDELVPVTDDGPAWNDPGWWYWYIDLLIPDGPDA